MKKKNITMLIIGVVIISILGYSISMFWDEEEGNPSLVADSKTELTINDMTLNILYYEGNLIDTELSYGNEITKYIEVSNPNDVVMSFAVSLDSVEINNERLTYDISYASEIDGKYHELTSDTRISGDTNLGYNIPVDKNSKVYIKLSFKANMENTMTIFKATLNVISNLSEKDIFMQNIEKVETDLLNNIDALNGINVSGYYIYDLSTMNTTEEQELNGYILIDATDISQLEFVYTIYNTKYMVQNFNATKQQLSKNDIVDYDAAYVNNLDDETVCENYTRKDCESFSSLKYVENGGKDNFSTFSKEITKLVETDFTNRNLSARIYIYDITTDISYDKDVSMRGYILVDNRDTTIPQYYLYLTNDIFMISGYNVTKFGDYNASSSTIRAYKESAFNLSASSKQKVCEFTGLGECYSVDDTLIT